MGSICQIFCSSLVFSAAFHVPPLLLLLPQVCPSIQQATDTTGVVMEVRILDLLLSLVTPEYRVFPCGARHSPTFLTLRHIV
jgi:hypothetical protein